MLFRSLQRAVDHIHAHVHQALSLTTIAAAACMSPRALEAAFRRRFDLSPLAYARAVRLEAVHQVLQMAALDGHPTLLSDVALHHGFIHMGRFAAYYQQHFGCSPSVTLRGHAQHSADLATGSIYQAIGALEAFTGVKIPYDLLGR